MNRVCFGCGVKLQCDDELSPGFIPSNKIDSANYCKRCFRLTHYGSLSDKETEKSTKNIIDNVNKDNIFKIYIVDLLNINDDTMEIFKSIKGNKLLLISKLDLLSKSFNKDKIIKRIKSIYDIKCDVKFVSTVNNYGVNSLINYLYYKHINKCYILGPTNSGKSTLINKLISDNNSKVNNLTVSNKRNTTLDFIRIKINDDLTIIDSPGFLVSDYGKTSKYKNIIKQITYNMKKGEVLFVDKFYIKFSEPTSVTLYIIDKINIKKYYKDIKFDYEVSVNSNSDICINGFGIINVKNSNNLSICGLDKNLISIRESIFGD